MITETVKEHPMICGHIPIGENAFRQIVLQEDAHLCGLTFPRSIVSATAGMAKAGSQVKSANWNAGGAPRSHISDLCFDGKEAIPDYPWTNAGELSQKTPVAHCLQLDGRAIKVRNVDIKGYRGHGIWMLSTSDHPSGVATFPTVSECRVGHCWTGIRNQANDAQYYGNVVTSVRDECFWDTTGNCQLSGNHFYGGAIGVRLGTVWNDVSPPGPTKSVGDTYADCSTGYYNVSAQNSTVIGAKVEHCMAYGMRLGATGTAVYDTNVYCPRKTTENNNPIGVLIEAPRCQFVGGKLLLAIWDDPSGTSHQGSTGMRIENHQAYVDTVIEGRENEPNCVGIVLDNTQTIGQGSGPQHLHIKARVNGFKGSAATNSWGVEVKSQLGAGCILEIWGHTDQGTLNSPSDKRLKIAAEHWNGAKIYINGDAVTPNTKYPP